MTNINKTIRLISIYLIEQLMKERKINKEEAVELLIKTSCFEMLMNKETQLYLEPRESIWSSLKEELVGNLEDLLIV